MVGKQKFCIVKKFWVLEMAFFGTFLSKKQQKEQNWAIFKSFIKNMAKCP